MRDLFGIMNLIRTTTRSLPKKTGDSTEQTTSVANETSSTQADSTNTTAALTNKRKYVGATAAALTLLASVASFQFQNRPEEGSGAEVYQESFIKDIVEVGDKSQRTHSKEEELAMIQDAFDWSIKQLKNNGVKVGEGNFGNLMFNYVHDQSYQKCQEQNEQFMHLTSYYLEKKEYQLENFKIGLAFDSKWIIEDQLPLKKHVWGVVVDRDEAAKPMPEDSRNVTVGIIDPWKGHTSLQDPNQYIGFMGVKWIPESVEFIGANGSSSYWEKQ